MRGEDWGTQVCSLSFEPDLAWLNCVGAYGIGSAAYCWLCTDASKLRPPLYIFGNLLPIEVLVYVDDRLSTRRVHAPPSPSFWRSTSCRCTGILSA